MKPTLIEVASTVAIFIGGPKDRLGRPDPGASSEARQTRERIREMAVQYGVAGGHHTYLDQAAALLQAAVNHERRRPDPLGEALNSGDGTYRP